MKNLSLVLLAGIVSLVTALTPNVSAQVTNAPLPAAASGTSTNPVVSLWDEASAWLTSPDTNNTTLENTYDRLETGPVLQSGVTIADEVWIERHFKSNKLALISQTENASIAGTIVYQGAGIGYVIYQKYDTEIVPFAVGGWRFDENHIQGGIGAKLRHMLNKAMYVAPSVEIDFGKKAAPKVGAEAGWSF